ncbi:ATP-grasp domain-containing protein [Exiguobacterium algae]|uniref:ATP-grasp domain-containing protein n=1 Tax=Exiguobacterium algae TaxID=2751250 RepID=UPI001BEA35E5|nr:ATP-grasp domain-containing protein [Exiguobacterium algae]
MKRYNVLLLSAGRRVELVQSFKQAAERLGIASTIIAGDVSEYAPALFMADRAVQLPRISHPDYIGRIMAVCREEDVSLVIPTIDTDLLLLAENKQMIELETGAIVLISPVESIKICRDKIRFQRFLEDHGFGAPRMIEVEGLDPTQMQFPLFIKPKSGSASIHTFKVNNEGELRTYLNVIKDPILQEFITGEEYTVDVFVDFNGKIISVCPRLRMETRGGEVSKGKITKDRVIIEDVKRLVAALGGIGHLTVQLKKDGQDIKYIEVNPRFGGGAPMSIQSGADSCEYLYAQLLDQELTYHEDYEDGLIFLRFDSSICIGPDGKRMDGPAAEVESRV